MKVLRFLIPIGLFAFFFSFVACDDQKTYAEQLKEMQVDIASFMSIHNYKTVDTIPTDVPWMKDSSRLFYETESGLYIHVADTGLQAGGVKKGTVICVRYREMSVRGDSVTYSNLYGSYEPVEICYGTVNTGSSSSYYWGDCKAWHEPLDYVGDYGHVMIIAPASIGMPIYNNSSTELLAHYYELKYTFWR